MDSGNGALYSSEKDKGKGTLEIMEGSKTISTVEGEDNSSAAGGLFPGDIGAHASQSDETTDDLAKKMQAKIDDVLKKPHNYTASKNISSVPGSTEDHGKKLHEPRAVAIGPYHRKTGENNFRITEEHKLWFVSDEIGGDLAKFLGKLKEREEEALKFYRERYIDPGMDSQSFLEMLMLDSCFILHALRNRNALARVFKKFNLPVASLFWASRDLVRAMELIKTDLLLLENQIPFFIIEDVFNMIKEKKKEGSGSIMELVLDFFHIFGLGRKSSIDKKIEEVHHLLHMYHLFLEPPQPPSHSGQEFLEEILLEIDPERYLPCATQLQQKFAVSIEVKKIDDKNQSVLDVTTCKSGAHIQIPALRVDHNTNILFHNLIHYEQSPDNIGDSYITACVAFMDHIVQSEGDVEMLENNGVLKHRLTGPKEVVDLFRQLHNVIDHYSDTPGYLTKLYKEVTDCCNSNLLKMYADAKQRYG